MQVLLVLSVLAVTQSASPADAVSRNDVKQYVTHGEDVQDVKVILTIGRDALTVARGSNDVTTIPLSAITSATYDRRERQRKFLGLPVTGQGMAGSARKRQHFLTVQYRIEGNGDFIELELGKDIAARVVATLEARSGKPVEKITQ